MTKNDRKLYTDVLNAYLAEDTLLMCRLFDALDKYEKHRCIAYLGICGYTDDISIIMQCYFMYLSVIRKDEIILMLPPKQVTNKIVDYLYE